MSTFLWQDYLVFCIMLVISCFIGIFFGIWSKKKHTLNADDMLTGSRNLPVLPVALSLSASFTSATTILGIPSEVYLRGGEQWLWIFGIIPCFLFTAFFILPIFYKLELTNAYEYFELRFNKYIRFIGSFAFSIVILVYMAVVLYAPAVALSQVTGLSKEISILTMGLVCTFYTSIGGIRAVVWADAFQLFVVWFGLLVLMFKGASDAGGWSNVWELAKENNRLPKFDMDPNPFVRHTFWTLLIGGGTNMMTVYGANQANLQRYGTLRTLNQSKLALLLNLPLWVVYLTILSLIGLVMYANFIDCDPLMQGSVGKPDQLVPFLVLESMGEFPGLPGLFIASIFSASISTVSSGINSLAAVTLEDLIKPGHLRLTGFPPAQRLLMISTVALVLVFGGITIGLAYLASLLGKTALRISFGIFGIVGGPLLGLIINGIFIPFVNSLGAATGFFASLILCLYAGIDPVVNPPPPNSLPRTISACQGSSLNTTLSPFTTISLTNVTEKAGAASGGSDHLYLSYLHYSTLALIVSSFVAVCVSLATDRNNGKDVDERTYYKYSWCYSESENKTSYSLQSVSHTRTETATENKLDKPNPEIGENNSSIWNTRQSAETPKIR